MENAVLHKKTLKFLRIVKFDNLLEKCYNTDNNKLVL